MFDSVKTAFGRRDLFRRGGMLAAAQALLGGSRAAHAAAPAVAGKLRLGPDIYQSIGVRPLINCRGTLTVISGSLELPEVRAAVDAGGQHHVVLDELMEGVARRLAELTGAEWALVSSGCAAGMAHTTAACVTGGNPDLHVRIPDLTGFAKDEVVIPKASRNEYDQAIRSVGVRIIEVGDAAEYEAALGPKVAMVYIMSRQPHGNRPAQLRHRLQPRQEEKYPGVHRCRRRDADHSQHLPAARFHLRGLQRRQVSARAAVRGPDPRPQRSAAGRLGFERAASRARPDHEDRQGRDARPAGRRRNVGAARSQKGRRSLDRMDADHRRPRHQDRWRHRRGPPAQGYQQPQSRAVDQLGCRQARHHGRRGLEHSVDHRASHRAGWWRRRRWRARRPCRIQPDGHFDHRVHDDAGGREDRRRPGSRDSLGEASRVESGSVRRRPRPISPAAGTCTSSSPPAARTMSST